MPGKKHPHDAALKALRAFGLGYPGAHTKSPWPEHLDLAVKDKTFCFMSVEGVPLSLSCKLPDSNAMALMLPFVEPTGYGLGKSGWVSAKFGDAQNIPLDMLKSWIDESYRAQAPKKLVAELDGGGAATASKKRSPTKKAARVSAKKAQNKRAG